MRIKYQRPAIDFKKKSRSLVKPNMAMSIDTIVQKFTRNIPIDILRRDPVWSEGDDDLESMSRMDFDDKAALAADKKAYAKQLTEQLEERERTEKEKRIEKAKAKQAQAQKDFEKHSRSLDNTMLHDTRPK